MFDLVLGYVEETFTDELKLEIKRAFNLFDYFEYDTAYLGMIDIVMNESNHSSETMHDLLVREINVKQDYVLRQHTIELIEEATISQKNEILQALAQIQNLRDYSGIIRTLESFESDDAQLASVLSELCILDETQIMVLIAEFDSTLLSNLKSYIYARENEENPVVNVKLVENFKTFCEIFPDPTIGQVLAKSGVLMGERFSSYLTHVEEELKQMDMDNAALNMLSVLYLSTDGFNSPVITYRKYSGRIFVNLDTISRVEVKLLGYIAKVEELLKAKNETSRISG